jgi:tetratricopeptide (TPR) repeat protein
MSSPSRKLIHHAPSGIDEGLMQPSEARQVAVNHLLGMSHDWLDVSNYASAHYVLGDTIRARVYAERALELNRNAHTLLNLGVTLETTGRFEEALLLAQEANALDPTDPFVGGLVADGLIRASRWQEGWPLYVKHHANWDWLRPAIREWEGPSESLLNKHILVLEGGGFGDNLIFLRYLPKLRALGAFITYMCPASLCPLVAENRLVDRLIPSTNGFADLIPSEYDCFVSLLALGAKFNETVESIQQWNAPYLKAAPIKTSSAIGICWKAGENVSPRKHRSLTLTQTAHILESRNDLLWTTLVVDELPPQDQVWKPEIKNWSHTASILSGLKLVITVDTGVAHLSGALGIPTWVLLPALSSWPFLLNRDDSPLYPSVRLFRSHHEGIDEAVESCISMLGAWSP